MPITQRNNKFKNNLTWKKWKSKQRERVKNDENKFGTNNDAPFQPDSLFRKVVTEGPTDGPTDQRTDGPTDGRTDGRTDKASYRDAWTHLKTPELFLNLSEAGAIFQVANKKFLPFTFFISQTFSSMWNVALYLIPYIIHFLCPGRWGHTNRCQSLRCENFGYVGMWCNMNIIVLEFEATPIYTKVWDVETLVMLGYHALWILKYLSLISSF